MRPALYNSRSLQADDIWLRDSDIVIVPKCPLQVMDDYINLIFTKGIYGVVPFTATFGVFKDISSAATHGPSDASNTARPAAVSCIAPETFARSSESLRSDSTIARECTATARACFSV